MDFGYPLWWDGARIGGDFRSNKIVLFETVPARNWNMHFYYDTYFAIQSKSVIPSLSKILSYKNTIGVRTSLDAILFDAVANFFFSSVIDSNETLPIFFSCTWMRSATR